MKTKGLKNTMRNFGIFMLVCAILFSIPVAIMAQVTEQDIIDAILGRGNFTDPQLQEMDVNQDGKVDVSDAVSIQTPIASFDSAESIVNETVGVHNVEMSFSKPVNGTLKYTIGGTATDDIENSDYAALPGSIVVNGINASIPVNVLSDTEYEGDESIKLTLLPSEDYLLGENRSHTITLKDNPEETRADYLFILGSETMGVSGDTTERKGFPPTLFSRTASVSISFSQSNVLSADLNIQKSIGFKESTTGGQVISASSISYDASTLELVFEYETQTDAFASDSSITIFNPENPDAVVPTEKALNNVLTLRINEFDIYTEKFTDKYLQGTFSIAISGVFGDSTSQFFNGNLSATMQQL